MMSYSPIRRHCCVLFVLAMLVAAGNAVIAAEVTSVDSKTFAAHGISFYNRGEVDNAIKYLEASARAGSDNPEVYYYLANCYVKASKPDQAAKMYSHCVKLAPASPAGKFSLSALETLVSMPKPAQAPEKPGIQAPDKEAVDVTKESLMSEAAIDKALNESREKVTTQRQNFKMKVDRLWQDLENDLASMNPRTTPNYSNELERVRREAEIKLEYLQVNQLRNECRAMAPEKIDVRAVPEMPKEKLDNTKTAMGSLMELVKAEKDFDPFGTELTPELTSKFMTLRDVFGETSTYHPAARRIAKQIFYQLKASIESKQDNFDRQILQSKLNLARDVSTIKANFNTGGSGRRGGGNTSLTPSDHMSLSSIPRKNAESYTPVDNAVGEAAARCQRRIKEMEETYDRDINSLIAGSKERLGGMVAQMGNMNTQLKNPSGNTMIVPLGTTTYTRNYVNFGERSDTSASKRQTLKAVEPTSLRAKEEKSSAKKTGESKTK